jgi:hypothetical protein
VRKREREREKERRREKKKKKKTNNHLRENVYPHMLDSATRANFAHSLII